MLLKWRQILLWPHKKLLVLLILIITFLRKGKKENKHLGIKNYHWSKHMEVQAFPTRNLLRLYFQLISQDSWPCNMIHTRLDCIFFRVQLNNALEEEKKINDDTAHNSSTGGIHFGAKIYRFARKWYFISYKINQLDLNYLNKSNDAWLPKNLDLFSLKQNLNSLAAIMVQKCIQDNIELLLNLKFGLINYTLLYCANFSARINNNVCYNKAQSR